MFSRFYAAALAVALVTPIIAQQPARPAGGATQPSLSTPLPVDAKVKIWTMPNGIRFYIRTYQKPE
jgi:hypothetical protein